jgi:hypothetical protein
MVTIRCGTRKGSFVYRALARSHTLMQEVPDLGTRIDLSICWGAFAIEVKILEGIPEIA